MLRRRFLGLGTLAALAPLSTCRGLSRSLAPWSFAAVGDHLLTVDGGGHVKCEGPINEAETPIHDTNQDYAHDSKDLSMEGVVGSTADMHGDAKIRLDLSNDLVLAGSAESHSVGRVTPAWMQFPADLASSDVGNPSAPLYAWMGPSNFKIVENGNQRIESAFIDGSIQISLHSSANMGGGGSGARISGPGIEADVSLVYSENHLTPTPMGTVTYYDPDLGWQRGIDASHFFDGANNLLINLPTRMWKKEEQEWSLQFSASTWYQMYNDLYNGTATNDAMLQFSFRANLPAGMIV